MFRLNEFSFGIITSIKCWVLWVESEKGLWCSAKEGQRQSTTTIYGKIVANLITPPKRSSKSPQLIRSPEVKKRNWQQYRIRKYKRWFQYFKLLRRKYQYLWHKWWIWITQGNNTIHCSYIYLTKKDRNYAFWISKLVVQFSLIIIFNSKLKLILNLDFFKNPKFFL